jgi:cytochrome c
MATGPAVAGDDIGAGQEIYQAQCSPCHSNQPGVNGIGPSLAGVAGRKATSLPGFHYTPALQGSGLTWTAENFTKFLADPSKLVPGTAMTVMVPDETGRADLYAYLPRSRTRRLRRSLRHPPFRRSRVRRRPNSKEPPPRPMRGSMRRTITPARASSTSIKSRRKTRRLSGPFASIAPS